MWRGQDLPSGSVSNGNFCFRQGPSPTGGLGLSLPPPRRASKTVLPLWIRLWTRKYVFQQVDPEARVFPPREPERSFLSAERALPLPRGDCACATFQNSSRIRRKGSHYRAVPNRIRDISWQDYTLKRFGRRSSKGDSLDRVSFLTKDKGAGGKAGFLTVSAFKPPGPNEA